MRELAPMERVRSAAVSGREVPMAAPSARPAEVLMKSRRGIDDVAEADCEALLAGSVFRVGSG